MNKLPLRFLTRFFYEEFEEGCLEYETKTSLPTLNQGEHIEIYEENYTIIKREYAINEDAFLTIYWLEKLA